MPRIVDGDDSSQFSAAEFERLLQQMRAEREALRADWQALVKKNARPAPQDTDLELQMHFKKILEQLQKRNQTQAPATPEQSPSQPIDPAKTSGEAPASAAPQEKTTGKEDISSGKASPGQNRAAQANALFRSRQFEDALATFRMIDLKGQKAEVRAPVLYLMAQCLIHLGKNDDALPLLREVANSRGDDKLAGYAQWQLEMLRWQRDMQDRLQDIRQRREAVEKRS
jgi:tetratricopeptide (TPR) repeat protein